jgi:glutamate synthase (NADPH) small chain
MGKPTGFKEHRREGAPKRKADERLDDFTEVYLEPSQDRLKKQASRCMDCGVPFCHQGCPLGNPIPDFNDLVYRGRWREAYERLAGTNDFPEFTGRLCPAPCEASCVLAVNGDAVTIEEIEKQIIERAFAEGWVVPRPPRTRTGKRVAIVGSGPAGLAAASRLNAAGHSVTVCEAADRIGGLLRYGIPDFKLEKRFIDRRLEIMTAEGVRFETSVSVGKDVTWRALKEAHDAVLIASGARKPRELPVEGRELEGAHLAMDYLEAQNRTIAEGGERSPIDAFERRVIILGGGDTGSDCLGTALRQRASVVHQIELLPAPPRERVPMNPWPEWPFVWRTSTSQEEGGQREFALLTKRLSGENGKLAALHAVRIDLVNGKIVERNAPELVIPCDLLILALGFTGPDSSGIAAELGVALDARGNIAAGKGYETSVDGVFVAGDAKRGASLIVWAIAEGREAARSIDHYLRGSASIVPARGQDVPFDRPRR